MASSRTTRLRLSPKKSASDFKVRTQKVLAESRGLFKHAAKIVPTAI
jgi:hypothetical protein